MRLKMIEAHGNGLNWGKFAIGQLEDGEWEHPSAVEPDGRSLMAAVGYWTRRWVWVLDLQTGEGAFFQPGGLAKADLDRHQIWVCPLFEPFLVWLYGQDLSDLEALPATVELPHAEAAMYGYRRQGQEVANDELIAVKDVLVGWCRPSTDAEKLEMIASILGVEREDA